MTEFREVLYGISIHPREVCFLGADIGGTNSNFGFLRYDGKKLELLYSVHVKSKTVTNFPLLVAQILERVTDRIGIVVQHAVFAVAGVVSEHQNFGAATNVNLVVDSKEILAATVLRSAFVVNDFVVVGYGLPYIDQANIVCVHQAKGRTMGSKAILGAGTGLGKCAMVWHDKLGRYVSLPSEGGHADFAVHTKEEYEFLQFMQKRKKVAGCAISWEDVLSGDGITSLYSFFHTKDHDNDLSHQAPHPDQIFSSRNQDCHAQKTFTWYARLYGRCAKNWALETLSLGGLYIAGGIAAKNVPLFEQDEFMAEFLRCGKQEKFLEKMPIYVITDYNVSLYGAVAHMIVEDMCA